MDELEIKTCPREESFSDTHMVLFSVEFMEIHFRRIKLLVVVAMTHNNILYNKVLINFQMNDQFK